jgi:hypothetical protein
MVPPNAEYEASHPCLAGYSWTLCKTSACGFLRNGRCELAPNADYVAPSGGTVQSTKPRIWRYEVEEVWGSMVGRMELGQIILDKWKADRCWYVMNVKDQTEGGWSCKLLGEAPPEMAETVRSRWAEKRQQSGRSGIQIDRYGAPPNDGSGTSGTLTP